MKKLTPYQFPGYFVYILLFLIVVGGYSATTYIFDVVCIYTGRGTLFQMVTGITTAEHPYCIIRKMHIQTHPDSPGASSSDSNVIGGSLHDINHGVVRERVTKEVRRSVRNVDLATSIKEIVSNLMIIRYKNSSYLNNNLSRLLSESKRLLHANTMMTRNMRMFVSERVKYGEVIKNMTFKSYEAYHKLKDYSVYDKASHYVITMVSPFISSNIVQGVVGKMGFNTATDLPPRDSLISSAYNSVEKTYRSSLEMYRRSSHAVEMMERYVEITSDYLDLISSDAMGSSVGYLLSDEFKRGEDLALTYKAAVDSVKCGALLGAVGNWVLVNPYLLGIPIACLTYQIVKYLTAGNDASIRYLEAASLKESIEVARELIKGNLRYVSMVSEKLREETSFYNYLRGQLSRIKELNNKLKNSSLLPYSKSRDRVRNLARVAISKLREIGQKTSLLDAGYGSVCNTSSVLNW